MQLNYMNAMLFKCCLLPLNADNEIGIAEFLSVSIPNQYVLCVN